MIEYFFSLLGALLISLILWQWRSRWKERAATRDHYAASPRQPHIPECCVGCQSRHATQPLIVGAFFGGPFPLGQLFDERHRRFFTFRCCLQCVRPILRRRRVGTILISIGVVLLAACMSFIVLLEVSDFFSNWFLSDVRPFLIARGLTPPQQRYGLVVALVSAFVFGAIGMSMRVYSPFVHVLDGGGDEIYFHFKSQRFRDQFARMNGE